MRSVDLSGWAFVVNTMPGIPLLIIGFMLLAVDVQCIIKGYTPGRRGDAGAFSRSDEPV